MLAGPACGFVLEGVSDRMRLECLFVKPRSRPNTRSYCAGLLPAPPKKHFNAAAVNRSFIVLMALVLCTIGLTACGGGGGGGNVGSISGTGSSSGDRSRRTPAVLPPSPILAGPDAIGGIDRIPSGMVKRTNAWMQKRWVIAERSTNHATNMGNIACQSYVVWHKSCERANRPGTHRTDTNNIDTRTGGSTPFIVYVVHDISDIISGTFLSRVAGDSFAKRRKIKGFSTAFIHFTRHNTLVVKGCSGKR